MPTVILLDVSLSMTRPVQHSDGTETTRKQLAEIGINAFLDYLSVHSKLEFISLVFQSHNSLLELDYYLSLENGGLVAKTPVYFHTPSIPKEQCQDIR